MSLEIDGVSGIIKNTTSDGDITIKGNDGGSEISALTFDISAAGAATFNNKIVATELDISGDVDVDGTTNLDIVDIDGAVNMATTLIVGGVITVIDGSTSAPSITNAGDTNSGIYFPADDNIGLVVGGSRKLLANSTGVTIDNGTFVANGGVVFNEGSADLDFRVESNNNANAIFVNGGTDQVTIGTNSVMQFIGGIAIGSENNSIFLTDSDVMDTTDTAAFDTVVGWTAGNALTTGDGNVLIGYGSGTTITTGSNNTFVGTDSGDGFDTEGNNTGVGKGALGGPIAGGEFNVTVGNFTGDAITSGDSNVMIGYQAGTATTTGGYNVFIGGSFASFCGAANTTGSNNIAIGTDAYDAADTESNNLAIGFNALGGAVAGGEFNVAVGNFTLDALTSADKVTAVGYGAGGAITSGGQNTFIGHNAGDLATTPNNVIAIGDNAFGGGANAGCNYNMAIGNESMSTAAMDSSGGGNSALNNTCVGHFTATDITSGYWNTIVGYQAGANITTGYQNIFMGLNAGLLNTTSHDSIFIGVQAGDGHDTEDNNLGIGSQALGGAVAGGEKNVAIGNNTLDALNSGDNNTAIGYNAAPDQTSGSHNLVVGADGGASIVGNSYNTIIGTHANTKNDNTSDEFQIALGYDCMSVGANFFTFGKGTGNDRVFNQYTSNASWSRVSDERYKKDIQDNTDCGLNFINDLRPITFKWKEKSELDPSFPDYDAENNNDAHPDKLYGLIAQEVKEALDKHNITDFGGWNSITTGEHTQQGISQEMFIHPLIKAVQELSATVTTLQQEINTLKGE